MNQGQLKYTTPQSISEGKYIHTKHQDIANSLNRQFVRTINKIIEGMEKYPIDPIIHYKKVISESQESLSFTFVPVGMSDIKKILSKLKSSGSTGDDEISLKMIKQASQEINLILLHLVNRIIKTSIFPEPLKTSKVVPIKKGSKDPYRSRRMASDKCGGCDRQKIIERVLLGQILSHLEKHKLIGHGHHGAMKNKSTQTLVNELHDSLLQDLREGKNTALIGLDQSKAYNIIDHDNLLGKLQIIGFRKSAINTMASYLSDRTQFMALEGKKSEKLLVGPRSVIQGSCMSTILFLNLYFRLT